MTGYQEAKVSELPFNLQIFAEQDPGLESTGDPSQENPPAETLEDILGSAFNEQTAESVQDSQETPLDQRSETTQQAIPPDQQSTEEQQEQQQEQQLDPVQQIIGMQQQQQQMMVMLAQMMQQNQQTGEADPEPEFIPPEMFTPQIPDTLPEELQREVDELYLEDPAKALAMVSKWQQEQIIKAQQEYAIQQQKEQQQRQQQTQQQFMQGFATLIQQHGRQAVDELGPRIEQIMMNEHPELLNFPQVGVQVAFQLAQTEKARAAAPTTFLQQPDVRQKIKDAVRKEIISEYLQGVQNGNQAPVTIAGQPGAATPTTPPSKPKTFDEAAEAMMKSYSG